uniref:histidine kinase n=1 Tax=Desulfomonile tiedjei TaxID=2358 RepID=A0A7C4ETH8_9BACT
MKVSRTTHRVLRRDIFIVSLCFSFIPTLLVVGCLYYVFQSAQADAMADALVRLAQNVKRELDIFFQDQSAQLVTIAHTHTLASLGDERYLGSIFDLIRSRSSSVVDIGVINERGAHVAYVGPHYEELKAVNYANEDWFCAVMETGVFISDVFLGFRKIPHVIIAAARREGGQTWILRATINTNVIHALVDGARLGKKGDALVVNGAGVLQVSSRFHGSLLTTLARPEIAIASESMDLKRPCNGLDSICAICRLENPKWTLILTADLSEHMGALLESRWWALLIIFLGMCAVIAAAFLVAKRLSDKSAQQETERARAEELMIQSNKMAALGKLAAGVAHEINNPLQIISDQAGWLKDLLGEEDVKGSASFSEFKEAAVKIQRAVDRCRSITHRLLAFGRRMEPSQESVDVNDALREVVTLLESEAAHRGIRMVTDFDQAAPTIVTDKKQLQQAFLNLLDNAVDAAGKEGTVTVKTQFVSGAPDQIVVSIADSGPGIPPELMERIFEPFFTTKGGAGSVGLGLSVVHSILEGLGGSIRVESELGRGATFVITLPVADGQGLSRFSAS